jgi:hypothetical protein
MMPAVSQLRSEGFKIILINVRAERGKATAAGVRRIPTIVYRENGEEVSRITRRITESGLRDMCRGL